jgi:nitroreductase
MNDALKAIANRRSLRKFKPGQISDSELQAVLDAGLQAPTGHNDQSCFFAVVQNAGLAKEISDGGKEAMRQIPIPWISDLGKNEKFNIFYEAPTVIIVAARKGAVSPIADVCAAIENMLIAAESVGVGSCWIGFAKYYFNGPERLKKLGIPEGYEVEYGVALGHKPDGLSLTRPARKYERYVNIIK